MSSEPKNKKDTTIPDPLEDGQSIEQAKLDAVRDILFGQNVKEYRDEIKELKELMSDNRQEIEKDISASNTEILNKIDQLSIKLDSEVKRLEQRLEELMQLKVNKSSLSNLFREIAEQLESN